MVAVCFPNYNPIRTNSSSSSHSRREFWALIAMIFGLAFQGAPSAMAQGVEPTSVLFSIPTADGAVVRGQVDSPVDDQSTGPIAILVSGTGGFDRDVYLGRSDSERDLIFLTLSRALTARGVAVARYDKRGVSCDGSKIANFSRDTLSRDWWNPDGGCEANPALTTATSGPQDLIAVYRYLERRYPGTRIVIFAHSEGMHHVALAVDSGNLNPVKIVGMGALMESPMAVFEWQRVERIPESLRSLDQDGDQLVTNEEVQLGFARTPAAVFGGVAQFLAPAGLWTDPQLESMRSAWEAYYATEKADALAKDDSEILVAGETKIATYGWWKQWFQDDTSVASRFAQKGILLDLFYGSIDSQTRPERQRAAVDAASLEARIIVFPELGHTLGADVFLGPMDPHALSMVVQAIAESTVP